MIRFGKTEVVDRHYCRNVQAFNGGHQSVRTILEFCNRYTFGER